MLQNQIKKIRQENKMTQKELAEILHIAPNTISQYENLSREVSLSCFEEILDVLGYKLTIEPKEIENPSDIYNYIEMSEEEHLAKISEIYEKNKAVRDSITEGSILVIDKSLRFKLEYKKLEELGFSKTVNINDFKKILKKLMNIYQLLFEYGLIIHQATLFANKDF